VCGSPKLLPRATDLSYFNYETKAAASTSSPQFQVLADSGAQGLLFRSKRDRHVLSVHPAAHPPPGASGSGDEGCTRLTIDTREYTQVVIYDHATRKKL
jgi:hypothetical protein